MRIRLNQLLPLIGIDIHVTGLPHTIGLFYERGYGITDEQQTSLKGSSQVVYRKLLEPKCIQDVKLCFSLLNEGGDIEIFIKSYSRELNDTSASHALIQRTVLSPVIRSVSIRPF